MVDGGWWVVVVSKPILVISLKPKSRLINLVSSIPCTNISLNHTHSTINPFRISYKEDPKPLNLSQPILNKGLTQLSQT